MDSNDISQDQAAKLAGQIAEHQRYFYALRQRLERDLGFPQSDMLLILVARIHDLLTELKMHCHYLGCDGTGDRRR